MWRWSAIAVLSLVLVGCSASLAASTHQAVLPDQARVVVDRIEGSTIWLLVYSLSDEGLTIDRDSIWLEVDGKKIYRETGQFGSQRFHSVPAGGVHDAKLEFDVPSGAGKPAELHLEDGIIARGHALLVPPIHFVTE
jgi:hypothetical protein